MKHKKKMLITGMVLLAGLTGIYFGVDFYMKCLSSQEENKKLQEQATATVLALPAASIRRISFPGTEGEITFLQEKNRWFSPQDPDFIMGEDASRRLTDDLFPLTITRTLENVDSLSDFGLNDRSRVIELTAASAGSEEAEEVTGAAKGSSNQNRICLRLGHRNDSNHELYFQLDSDGQGYGETVYLTRIPLDEDFNGRLQDFAAYEPFPSFDVRKICTIKTEKEENGYTLNTPGDGECTVTDDTGDTQPASVSLVGLIHDHLANCSWLKNLEYHCKDLSAYGLLKPRARIRILGEKVDAVQEENDKVESGTLLASLLVGGEDENGNYYVQLEGSLQVHSVRREYLEDLVEKSSEAFWSLNYSFVSIGDLDRLQVSTGGESYTLRRLSDDGSQTDDHLSWLVDDRQVSKEAFNDFYYACVSVTAQERLYSVPVLSGEPLLKLEYQLTDGSEKTVTYYETDQNFCTVLYDNDTKAASTNRLYVNRMLDKLASLLEES